MIVEENDDGDLRLQMSAELHAVLTDHLATTEQAALVIYLERFTLRAAVRLERLAKSHPDLARDRLHRHTGSAGKVQLSQG